MPTVELVDLLRKDRELDGRRPVTAEHFATSVRFHLTEPDEAPRTAEIAVGTARIACPSRPKLALGCVAAFAGGFARTIPLGW